MKLQVLVDKDPGLTGNLLVERLVGAHVDLVSKEEYAKIGSDNHHHKNSAPNSKSEGE